MISLKKPFKFIIYSLMLVVTQLFSQQLSEEDFSKRLDEERGNYSVQNYDQNFLGRPGYVWGIIKSKSDNLIYMASNSGILEYDGVNVRRVMVKEDSSYQSGFGNGLARTFVQMEDGTIYVTGNSKFGRLVKNEFGLVEYEYLLHNLPDSIDYRRQIIWGALEHEGNVIFYTPNFVFSWDGEKFNNVWKFSDYAGGRASYGKIHAFSKAGNTLYTRRWGYGLYKLIDNKFQYIKNSEFLSQNRIELFYETKKGDLLLFSRTIGAYILKKNGEFIKSTNTVLNDWLIENGVYVNDHLKPFSDGTIPIHSRGGILIIDEDLNILNNINTEDGLATPEVNITFIDNNDVLYLGTTVGASIINLNNFLNQYDKNNGIDGYVRGKIDRVKGEIYFASSKDMYSIKPSYDPMINNSIKDLEFNDMIRRFSAFDNSIIASHNYGLSEYDGKEVEMISSDYDIPMAAQSKLNNKLLLVGHNVDGLKIMRRDKNGKFQIFKTFQPEPGFPVTFFEEISPGKLILSAGGERGTYFADYDYSGNFTFTKIYHPLKDSIVSTLPDSLKSDLSLLPDSSFRWGNTNIGYVAFSDSLTVHKIDFENNKLIYTGINMSEIRNKRIFNRAYNYDSKTNWIFTRYGVYEIKFYESDYEVIKIHNWGEIDYSELTTSFVEGKKDNQTVWLGSEDSKLIRWLPYKSNNEIRKNNIKPLLRGFYVNNNLRSLDSLELEYDSSRTVKFEYAYPVFNKEENNQYRVFLKGFDSDTSDWTNTPFREYTNLGEKDYEFFIQARDTNGNESEFISFSFSILPPWYRTIYAYVSYLVLLAFGFWSFGKYQAKKSLEKADNERRAGELEEAKKIQQSMLPKVYPKIKSFDVSAGLVTSTEIGGDYYDFFEKGETLYAVCGDATGHGTASGMMVSIIKSALNGLPALSTNKVLYELNNIVKKIDLGTLKMSLNICEVNKNKITLSSAAMPPVYLYNSKSKKTEEILIKGLPLGGLKNETFDIQKRDFKKGDVLVMLSDGLPEAENSHGELYDYDRVLNLITKFSQNSSEEIRDKLISEVDRWLEGGVPDDDVTIVVIKKNS